MPTAPEQGLDAYIVGGYVRDKLLGKTAKDRDWVVVGATVEDMLARGFRPVGKDFPVFLHPFSKEEYALARTERKTGKGYKGFTVHAAPDVSLEQDLLRRDLTINAMAMTPGGRIIDPLDGQKDLRLKLLRHASPAFTEDPLRVLRLARFAAQLGFDTAPETLQLCRQMAASGELQALTPERVWQETQRAMTTPAPQRFVKTLRACGALAVLFPEIDALFGVPQPEKYHPEIDTGEHVLLALEQAAQMTDDPLVRFAVLLHDLGKGVTPRAEWPSHRGHEARGVPLVERLCKRYRVPNHYRRLAVRTARYHLMIHFALELKPKTLAQLLNDLDAYRNPEDFQRFLIACEADVKGRKNLHHQAYPQADFMRELLHSTQAISAQDVAKDIQGKHIGEAIRRLRIQRIAQLKRQWQGG